MNDELRRILALVKDGKLSEEQGAAMIEALKEHDGEDTDYRDEIREHRRHSRRRRSGSRHADAEFFEDLGINIGGEVASIIDKSLRGLNAVLGGTNKRFGPTTWLNDSNVNVMSKLHNPAGENYTCRDNNFTVSKVDDLNLSNAGFCDNEFHAAAIKGASVNAGEFKGNELRGSSLKDLNIDNGAMTNCQLNGAQLTAVNINNGKLDDSALNGAQLRDIDIDDSTLTECMFNGAKVNDFNISGGSTISELKVNGAKCHDIAVTGSRVTGLRLSGVSIDVLNINDSTLDHVVIRCQDWKELMGRNPLPTSTINDLEFDSFKGNNLEFVNCTFADTAFRDCDVSDMTFTDVNFSGLTLDSRDGFAELADERVA